MIVDTLVQKILLYGDMFSINQIFILGVLLKRDVLAQIINREKTLCSVPYVTICTPR